MPVTESKNIGTDTIMDRKTFLKKLGRFSLLVSLIGLGRFLYKRNTCAKDGGGQSSPVSPCDGCRQISDCTDTKAEKFRFSTDSNSLRS